MNIFDDWLARKLAEPPQPHVIILSRFARSQEVIPQEKLDAIVAAIKEDSRLDVVKFAESIGVAINTCADFGEIETAAKKADLFPCECCERWVSTADASDSDEGICQECQDEIDDDEDIDDDMDDDDDEYDDDMDDDDDEYDDLDEDE